MGIASINPATGEILSTFTPLTSDQIQSRIQLAQESWLAYRRIPIPQKAVWMQRVADLLDAKKGHWGEMITQEMGKTLASAIAEVEKSALVCRYYADHAAELLADEPISTDASRSWIRYAPLGVLLAVMPWNFPFWQVFRFAAPALMAGNTALLKHASNVPQSALAIQEICEQAGFPVGVFQTLLISGSQVAEVIADPRVKAASLTGSEAAGISLASSAAQEIKPVVLELGGSDPFIILASADLDRAITTAVNARLISNGQSCIAAKRFIVQSSVADRFLAGFTQKMGALRVGDPLLPETQVGPLATPGILDELEQQVNRAVQEGAKVRVGGHRLRDRAGLFFAPTVLTDVPLSSPVAQEEMFGPVAMVFTVEDVEGAIALANATPFGLGASAWTQDPKEQEQLIDGIEAGSVFINGMTKSDPRLPFGGVKRSGYGRELGRQGIQALVNIKTVWVH